MNLSTDQQKGADTFMDFLMHPTEKEMILDGSSGCGKSYLTKHFIEIAKQSSHLIQLITNASTNLQIYCTATTNKAAGVLANSANQDAQTIHSLLGLKVTNNFQTGKTSLRKTGNYEIVRDSLIIIDEASMIDKNLLKIIRESAYRCKTLYVGDSYQLTPIFESTCPVFDAVDLKATLTTYQRQIGTNNQLHPIAALGEEFRQAVDTGIFPKIVPNGTSIFYPDGPTFQRLVNQEYLRKDRLADDAKIIAWTNNRVIDYNKYVRKLTTQSDAFTIGELVVTNKPIIKNNQTYYQTDAVAKITGCSTAYEQQGIEGYDVELDSSIKVFLPKHQWQVKSKLKQLSSAKNWVDYFGVQEFFADIRPIHSSTTHKGQGSTYSKVFIDLSDIGKNHNKSEVARLLYVATTRAANEVIFYGELPKKYRG